MTVLAKELDNKRLVNVIFNKETSFTLNDIFSDLGISDEDRNPAEIRGVLNTLKDNGMVIQQGSVYSIKP